MSLESNSSSFVHVDPIPVIDFQCLSQRKENDKLEEACKEWGVFRLVNHGIPETLLSQRHNYLNNLFSLSMESKLCLFTNPLTFNWGPGFQSESLVVPVTQLSQIQSKEDHTIISFRDMLDEYGNHMFRVASTLNEAMAKNLNMEKMESRYNVFESTGLFRMHRYKPCPNPDEISGMDVHTDSSTLAILNENHVGGLQVLKNEEWFTLKPIPNTLVVNLRDMMKVLSKDQYHNVKHMVKLNKNDERISICYFVWNKEL